MTQKGKSEFFSCLLSFFISIFLTYNRVCAKISVNALIEYVHVTGRTVEINKKLVRIYKNIVSFIKIHQSRALIVSR